ncbi:hypothetical protein [Streptomyces sp. A0592]|uniref:hypothetical protein n=1 Tax=Streptomyces sp. A0592 TaxID=2563099 RepID=UPI00109EB07A|nr:hypothetical protein [Streptomyces sp. A0592]THA78704.1 hypothetical protein E6U81_33360 [Streptomyces sp. A0592]
MEGEETHQALVVCSYSPAGNIIGRFRENVRAPVGGCLAALGDAVLFWTGVATAAANGRHDFTASPPV